MRVALISVTLRRNRQLTLPVDVCERLKLDDRQKPIVQFALIAYKRKEDREMKAIDLEQLEFLSGCVIQDMVTSLPQSNEEVLKK